MIDDIHNDAELIPVIDEIKHRIKPGVLARQPICLEFNKKLNRLIAEFLLGEDPHVFASPPPKTDP